MAYNDLKYRNAIRDLAKQIIEAAKEDAADYNEDDFNPFIDDVLCGALDELKAELTEKVGVF